MSKLYPQEKYKIKRAGKDKIVYCDGLDDAYEKGFFSGSLSREELFDIIVKRNPELRYIYSKYGIGIYDTHRGQYIAPVGRVNPIPQFTLMRESDNKCLCRSWHVILDKIRRKGYEINYDY